MNDNIIIELNSSNNNNTRVKGPWSPEKDAVLSRLVAKFGARNWSLIARGIPGRSGKSCRLRWCNQLDPCLKRKPFTVHEDVFSTMPVIENTIGILFLCHWKRVEAEIIAIAICHQNLLLHPTLSLPTSTAVFFEPNLHRLAFGKRESARKMSGPGKKVVDVAFKASKNIDWEGMAKLLVSDEARKEFATLRRTFDEVNSTLQTKFSQVFFLYSL
ncbi:hypothetical protein GOBAR_DD20331 [Gossypium barbadense]|nr:hypothetical protein GOBAR_DD20331 [Gossypium barbadense]